MQHPRTISADPLVQRALTAGEEAWRRGALDRAHAILSLALARAERLNDAGGSLCAHQLLGHVAYQRGKFDDAALHHQAVLERSKHLELPLGTASALHNLGLVAAASGDLPLAARLLTEALAQYDALDHASGAALVRDNLRRLATEQVRQLGASDEYQ